MLLTRRAAIAGFAGGLAVKSPLRGAVNARDDGGWRAAQGSRPATPKGRHLLWRRAGIVAAGPGLAL